MGKFLTRADDLVVYGNDFQSHHSAGQRLSLAPGGLPVHQNFSGGGGSRSWLILCTIFIQTLERGSLGSPAYHEEHLGVVTIKETNPIYSLDLTKRYIISYILVLVSGL